MVSDDTEYGLSLFSCGNTDRVTTGYRVALSIAPRVQHRLIELVAQDAGGIMPGSDCA